MTIKKGLISVLIFLLLCSSVYGGTTSDTDMPGVVASGTWQSTADTTGQAFFLFASGWFSNKHSGTIVCFNSDITVDNDFNGNIYLLFSTAHFGENARVLGGIYTLSSFIESTAETGLSFTTLFIVESLFYKPVYAESALTYDGRLPTAAILFIFVLLRQLLCVVIYGVKPGFFEQGSVLLTVAPQDIIRFGLLTYFVIISTALIFLMSVVGVIITVLVLLLGFLLVVVGHTSLNISIGLLVTGKLKIRQTPYLCGIIGAVLTESIIFIPVIGFFANVIFLPILCLGILAAAFINGFFRRHFFETPFDTLQEKANKMDMDSVRNIIKYE